MGKGQGAFPSGGTFLRDTALRRFYKIAKGLLYSESDVRQPLFLCVPQSVAAVYFWQEKCYDTLGVSEKSKI